MKDKLKTMYLVELRDGEIRVVMCDVLIDGAVQGFILVDKYGYHLTGDAYSDELKFRGNNNENYDVMKIYKNSSTINMMRFNIEECELIWRRKVLSDNMLDVINDISVDICNKIETSILVNEDFMDNLHYFIRDTIENKLSEVAQNEK